MINHSYSCGLTPREKKLKTPFNRNNETKSSYKDYLSSFRKRIEKFVYLFIFFFLSFVALFHAFHSYTSLKIDL